MLAGLTISDNELLPDPGTAPEPCRGRSGAENDIGTTWLDPLGRAGCGVIVLSHLGDVRRANAQAVAMLTVETGFTKGIGAKDGADAVKALLARGSRPLSLRSDEWTVIVRDGRRPLLLHAVPIPQVGSHLGDVVLTLIDLDRPPTPNQAALMRVFGLTAAEARLTALLTDGASPSEAATAQGVSLSTVRKHLVSIFEKTGTRGQVELVALASRLAGLP